MATITAGDFRNGKTFEMDGKIMQVVEFQHVKPGKGAAFVRTKMKNIVTGAVTEPRHRKQSHKGRRLTEGQFWWTTFHQHQPVPSHSSCSRRE